MEHRAKIAIALTLGLFAIAAVFVTRRASAATAAPAWPPPLGSDDFSVSITPRPLAIAPAHQVTAPLTAFDRFTIAVGDVLGPAVDQVKDALKGLGLWSRDVPERFRELFATTGAQYRLPPGLLEAVAYRESRFREDIIDGRVRSTAGAVGILQIVPRWHPELGEAGALDPIRAVPYAARYLRSLFVTFGSWKLALAAYNWGQGNLSKADPSKGAAAWPDETRIYVAEIAGNAGLA